MSNYAVIESNIVINVIVADSKEIAEMVTGKQCVDLTGTFGAISDTWDGEKFIRPIVEVEETP